MPVILAMQEVEGKRIVVQGQQRKVNARPYLEKKLKRQKGLGHDLSDRALAKQSLGP
jgi:hypothetical protein